MVSWEYRMVLSRHRIPLWVYMRICSSPNKYENHIYLIYEIEAIFKPTSYKGEMNVQPNVPIYLQEHGALEC